MGRIAPRRDFGHDVVGHARQANRVALHYGQVAERAGQPFGVV
jgi:hypothetical protein